MKVIPIKLQLRLFRLERDEALLEHDSRFWQRYFEAYGLVVRGIRTPNAFDGAIREQLEKDADLLQFERDELRLADEYQESFDERDKPVKVLGDEDWEELFGLDSDFLEKEMGRYGLLW